MSTIQHDTPPETVQSRITAQLREALVQGRFVPGEALKIRDIAEAFGTSTQPVRGAIKQLVTEQALEALPNRSARVPLLRKDKLEDLTQVRIAVEGLAVALAVKNVSAKDIARLKKILNLKPRDEAEHLANHRDFHFTLYRLSGSTTVMPIIESLWLQLGPYLRQATHVVIGQSMADQHHVALIEALERGDARAARKAVEADIRGSAELFAGAPLHGSAVAWLGVGSQSS
jgi:DNA-binding GntR family transcriptional regulator